MNGWIFAENRGCCVFVLAVIRDQYEQKAQHESQNAALQMSNYSKKLDKLTCITQTCNLGDVRRIAAHIKERFRMFCSTGTGIMF